LLLSRMMDLNDVQEGVLNIAFRVADEQGLLLLDLKDLPRDTRLSGGARRRAHHAIRQRDEGDRSAPSSASFWFWTTRAAPNFFGEPALALQDLMKKSSDGRGYVNILVADKLMENPRLYATFLLWLLSELFEQMPEVGDLDKPKLVFFFDEAHLLFNDAPKALLDRIEQVVRLIRSKGCRRVLRHAKPDRRSGQGAGSARQPRAACAPRLHAA
jgi:DNA helicase HerA-like ATPase